MFFPNVWDLVEMFKTERCRKIWKIFEDEDLVNTGTEYHYFVWSRHIRPSTFRRVNKNLRFPIRDGASYRMVDVSYVAWITPEPVSERVTETLDEIPDLSRKIAMYDVSPMYMGRPVCLRINETNSVVFQEFERFLVEKYGVDFKPLHRLRPAISSV